jgi:hypothetical protein
MGSATLSVNDLRERILGTWRMLSWKRSLVPSGEQSDALGPNPSSDPSDQCLQRAGRTAPDCVEKRDPHTNQTNFQPTRRLDP